MNFPIPLEVQAPTCPVITDQSVLKAIGNTPLIRIHNLGKEFKDVDIYAKAEWKNAGGSVKSRPALKMIEDADRIGVDVIQLGPTDPMEMTQDICVNESNREIFEENFELARLRAEELGVNIQLLKGF